MPKHTVGRNSVQRGLVAYPTESFYALGVDATDARAIEALFRAKHREEGKPIALIAANLSQVMEFFHVSNQEKKLGEKHWPGPLTILLQPKKAIAARALGATRIGVRVPAHAGARRLAAQAGAPLTATSANISGQPATKSAAKVKRDFPGILVIAGRCGQQTQPSTVIELRKKTLHILRQGSVHL